MKLCYKVCTSKCIEVDFRQIYDYIRTQNPNFSLEGIEWSFRDSVDYYLRVLYSAWDFNAADNEYRTEDLCISWSKWLKKNAEV
jgi:hypothetical protein